MAEEPPTGSQSPACVDSHFDDRINMEGPFRRRCLPSKGNFAWEIVRLHAAVMGE